MVSSKVKKIDVNSSTDCHDDVILKKESKLVKGFKDIQLLKIDQILKNKRSMSQDDIQQKEEESIRKDML